MRPRRDAAEYYEAVGGTVRSDVASMRPRRDAAEYLNMALRVKSFAARFNEAAA